MKQVIALHHRVFSAIETACGGWFLPSLARFTFAATLLIYFWNSAMLKIGDGILGLFHPTLGAYAQIFPKAMEAAGYNTDNLTDLHWAVVVAGTTAEIVLPLLIVFGLFTRLAAIGMAGFVVVQSLTDLYGHGGIDQPDTVGAWFDIASGSVILDQRLFWMLLLAILMTRGAGPLSVDRLLRR